MDSWVIRKRKIWAWVSKRRWKYLKENNLGSWISTADNSSHWKFKSKNEAQTVLNILEKNPEYEYQIYRR